MPHPRSMSGARRWTLGALVTLLLALGAALLPALPAHALPTAQTAGGGTLYALANEARFANGQAGLLRNASLDAVAAAWADQLAANGALSHNPDYTTQIPGGWRAAGENVAQGYPTEAAMHNGWMNSSGHRANILGDFTDVGIAFHSAGGTTWGVQVFAKYPGHAGPAAPAPPPPPAEAAPAPAPVAEAPAAEAPASESATEPEPTPEPTPSATPTATARATATPVATRTAEATDARATPGDDPAPWLWAGIPAVTFLAAAGATAIVLARRRGRHTA